MKAVKTLLLSACALAALGTGCAKKQVVADAPVTAPAPVATTAPADDGSNKKDPSSAELDAAVRQAVLHFGFNESTLTPDSQEKLRVLAEALRKRPSATVRIAGHADERGTEEYNLALGQRRAAVARKYLLALGVPEKAVDTVSFGAERPAVNEHNEDAWQKNRRAETEPTAK